MSKRPSLPPRASVVRAIEQMQRLERNRDDRLQLSRELAEWREAVARRLKMQAIHPRVLDVHGEENA